MTPYTLKWWIYKLRQSNEQARWAEYNMNDCDPHEGRSYSYWLNTNSKFRELSQYIEKRIIDKYGEK